MLSSIFNVIIMFSCDLLQLCRLGDVPVLLSTRFRRAVGVIASTQFSLRKWIQRATAKQKSDEHDFAACKSTGFAAAGGRHRFFYFL